MDGPPHEPGPECRCYNCGFVVEALVEERRVRALKEQVIEAHQAEIVRLRQQLGVFRAEAEREAKASPWAGQAREVFNYWKTKIAPRAREFNGKRRENVIARLKHGASVQELCLAVDGAKIKPFIQDGKVFNDLEVICRTEKNVMHFIAIAEAARQAAEPETSRAVATSPEVRQRERELATYRSALNDMVADRLATLRGWSPVVVKDLELGLDGGRVVFPARDDSGALVGFQRYAPNPAMRGRSPKALAEGERELFPRPERYHGGTCWLVEGEPDALAAITCGLQAIGVPGVGTWKAGWANRLERFDQVHILFDCDKQGREAADARQRTLHTLLPVKVIDMDPTREDGYDVTDLVLAHGPKAARTFLENAAAMANVIAPMNRSAGIRINPMPDRNAPGDPILRVINALEIRGLRVTGRRPELSAQCPAHPDHHASMSIGEGSDGRALLTCHAGCDGEAILAALHLTWADLFVDHKEAR